jgi:hypothetical protein
MNFKLIVALSLINSGIFIGAEEDRPFRMCIYDLIDNYRLSREKGVWIQGRWRWDYIDKEDGHINQRCYKYNDKEKKFEKIFEQSIYNEEKDIAILEESKAILEKMPDAFEIKTDLKTKKTSFFINKNNSKGLLDLDINTTDLTKEQKIDLILRMKKCINPDWSLKGMIFGHEKPFDCIRNLETVINNSIASKQNNDKEKV